MGKLFQLQAIWTWAPNNSQMSLNTRRSKVAHVFIVSMSIKFHSVSLLCFWDTGHFEASVPNDPKMTFNPTRWNVPHYMCYYCPQIPNFSPFHSTTSRFRATGHFETNALNDPQMTLYTTRSNIPYIYVLCDIPESQISVRFTLQSAVSELQVILVQMHRMTPKMALNTTMSKVTHIHVKITC